MDSDGEATGLVNYAGEALEQCGICRAFDRASQIPIAGTTTVSPFNAGVQVGLLFFGDAIAPHARGICSKYSLLVPVRRKGPREVWGARRRSRADIFGRPK